MTDNADLITRLRQLARHEHSDTTFADEAADEIEHLRAAAQQARAALTDIADPITAWRRDMKPGEILNGPMCVHLANSPETYKDMARNALRALDAALGEKT